MRDLRASAGRIIRAPSLYRRGTAKPSSGQTIQWVGSPGRREGAAERRRGGKRGLSGARSLEDRGASARRTRTGRTVEQTETTAGLKRTREVEQERIGGVRQTGIWTCVYTVSRAQGESSGRKWGTGHR
eukprot:62630-Prorocentrum_minimum.AAC.1